MFLPNVIKNLLKNLELLRALGPLIIYDVSISESSLSSFKLFSEPSSEAAKQRFLDSLPLAVDMFQL